MDRFFFSKPLTLQMALISCQCLNPNTFFRFSPPSRQIGAEQMTGSPRVSIRGPLAHQAHDPGCQANLCHWPASELVIIYTFA